MSVGTIDILDILRLLWRHKAMIMLAAVVAGTAAFAIGKSLPLWYTSEGVLLIEYGEPLIPELNAGARPSSPDLGSNRTAADVLGSRALVEGVVRDLGLAAVPDFDPWIDRVAHLVVDQLTRLGLLHTSFPPPPPPLPLDLAPSPKGAAKDPADATVELVLRRLWIGANDRSRILAIHLTARSPELTARVVNALMDRYIAEEVAAKRDLTVQTNRWLTDRVAALRADVEAADRRVQEFRQESGLLEIEAGLLPSIQLSTEQGQLASARQDAARLQSAIDTAQQMAARSGSAAAAQETLASPLIQRLRDREAEIVQRIAKLSQVLGSKHPDRLAAEAELPDVRRQIEAEVNRIVAALSRDLKIARDRVAKLEDEVATMEATARSAGSAQVTLAQLMREADAKRQVYQAFLARAEQTQFAAAQFPSALA